MILSVDGIPFSRYGSYFALSYDSKECDLFIKDFHGGDEVVSKVFAINLGGLDGLRVTATETEFSICCQNGTASFVIDEKGSLHLKMDRITLKMMQVGGKYDSIVPHSTSCFEAFFYKKNRKMMINCIEGKCQKFGEWVEVRETNNGMLLNSSGGTAYIVIDNYKGSWKPTASVTYEETKASAEIEYAKWKSKWQFSANADTYAESIDLAVYLMWANFVKAEGMLAYDASYCSKNWMNNIWSWDNCFSSIGLAPYFPKLAYEQIKMFFSVQDESGCYPDYVNDVFASYSCCKPPIHAWALREMRSVSTELQLKDLLEEAYESFVKVTNYWLDYRIPEGFGLPSYNHGNDSGWDNSSVFHAGVPVISPDLSAHIVRQLDILSAFAKELGRETEATELARRADSLFDTLMRDCFDGERFFAVHVPTGKRVMEGDSLLTYIPLILGSRLPKDKLDFLVNDLLVKFEGTYGLCTENPKSAKYKKGGYWLGPIWAPVTYLLIDALHENGYEADAKRLAHKFFALTAVGKMAENFDAFSGEGQNDPAYSWTSAVFLHLLRKYQ